jgi:hypothetical protein
MYTNDRCGLYNLACGLPNKKDPLQSPKRKHDVHIKLMIKLAETADYIQSLQIRLQRGKGESYGY